MGDSFYCERCGEGLEAEIDAAIDSLTSRSEPLDPEEEEFEDEVLLPLSNGTGYLVVKPTDTDAAEANEDEFPDYHDTDCDENCLDCEGSECFTCCTEPDDDEYVFCDRCEHHDKNEVDSLCADCRLNEFCHFCPDTD